MKPVFKTGSSSKGISIDPRTKLFLLLVGNITVMVTPSLAFEIGMTAAILVFGVLSGVTRFSLKMVAGYGMILILQLVCAEYLLNGLGTLIVTFAIFMRKIFPCVMLGGILVSTTRVNEFMAAMNRIHMPRSVTIPFAVMLRYFPMISEEWSMIKDAMRMRGVSPDLAGFFRSPMLTVECIYVPLLLSATKIADELSAAAVTRGIENPGQRTCLKPLRFQFADAAFALFFTVLLGAAVIW